MHTYTLAYMHIRTPFRINACAHLEAVVSSAEAPQEVLHDWVGVALAKAVEHKAVTHLWPIRQPVH